MNVFKQKLIAIGLGLLVDIWDYLKPKLYELAKDNDNPIDDVVIDVLDVIINHLKKDNERGDKNGS